MDQEKLQTPAPRTPWRNGLLFVGVVAALAAGVVVGRNFFSPAPAALVAPEDKKIDIVTEMPDKYFSGWGTPESALLLTGQTFGYLQPCGCSYPQYGGLVRRYNVVKMLEKKGWKVAGVDLGEIYPPKAELAAQAREKFKTTLRAQELMNYQDFGLGIPEMKMPLVHGLAEMLALNIKNPRPVSLDLKDPNKVFEALAVRSYDIIDAGKNKVGVSALVGPSVAKQMAGAKDVEFFANDAIIPALLPALAKNNVDVVVLLVHGTQQEAEDIAKACFKERQKNPGLPNVDLIVHTSDFDTPPARPQLVPGTNTRIIYPGHKGKDIGILGLFRKAGGGFELKYELVHLGPEFDTPEAQKKGHPLMQLMEDYTANVKNSNFLEQYRSLLTDHPTQRDPVIQAAGGAKYVGSEVCANCHPNAAKVWATTGHSHAYKRLEDAKEPGLRQFDPECIACHTVGFKHRTGFYDPPADANAKQIEKHNTKLHNVGCESCHGPGSMHANNPDNKAFYPIINPIKSANNPNFFVLLDRFCQSCHDIENDVHWGNAEKNKTIQKNWAKIAHPGIP